MQADILLYMNDLQGALECYESVIEGVKELGDKRAEFLARGAVAWVYIQMGGLDEAREHIHRARERIIEMDARRFLMNNNTVLANLALAEGDQERARKHLDEAEDVSQTLGIAWLKPWRLGVRTQVARNDAERLEAIASAEAIFAAGEGNYVRLEFYDNAIEGCIAAQDWDTVDRLAKACEEFFGPKPLEGARFVVERARTLAAVGNGKCDPETLEILRRLRKEAESAKRLASIPPIDAALASCSH